MLKIFISSHGKMASGIKSTLNILIGENDKLYFFDAYIDGRNLKDELDAFFEGINDDDQIILLSDLYGGSVNQIMSTYLSRDNTFLVAGYNLSLIIELSLKEFIEKDELTRIVEEAKEMIKIVDLDNVEITNDEFF